MNKYLFESDEFGISNDGIHLLRSRFNYKTIPSGDIQSIVIQRGKEINNWLFVLILGVALLAFSIFYSTRLFFVIYNREVNVIYIEEILVPLFPFLVGCYCLFTSLKKGNILMIRTREDKQYNFPLKKIEADNFRKEFDEFLMQRYKFITTIR